jgi:hypothetical protein
MSRGEKLADAQKWGQAERAFVQALIIKPTQTKATVRQAVMLYNLGSTDRDIKAVIKAEELLSGVISLGGEHASSSAYFYLGVVQEATNRAGPAIANWERAVDVAVADVDDINAENARAKLQAAFPAQCLLPPPLAAVDLHNELSIPADAAYASAQCTKKTALLFMVKDEVHFDALWQAWGIDATDNGHCFKPIVHYSHSSPSHRRTPSFAHELVPSLPSSWCKIVPVQIALIAAALADPLVTGAVFLSANCVSVECIASFVSVQVP